MGPLTRAFWQQADSKAKHRIERAAHVLIDEKMWHRLGEILVDSGVDTPFEGRMPHHCTVIEIEGGMSIMAQDLGEEVEFYVLATRLGAAPVPYVGTATKRSINVNLSLPWIEVQALRGIEKQTLADTLGTMSGQVDVLWTLMAEPRFIVQQPFSRMKRGMAAKKLGKRGLDYAWVKLGWNMDEAVKAKDADHDPDAPQRGYHLVRAHWRSYGDRQTKHAVRREGKPGWWCWIESHHRGHPALGHIRHQYHPRMNA